GETNTPGCNADSAHAAMRCEHGKCNNLGFMQEQKALPSTVIKLSCTTLSLRIPRPFLFLHILCHSCAKLNLGVVDIYACSHVRLSEILHAPIHDELNNSHKRKGTTRTHNHIETLCMVRCLNTIPYFVGIIKE